MSETGETMSFADESAVKAAPATANGGRPAFTAVAEEPNWVTAEDIDALFDKEIDPAKEDEARKAGQPSEGWYTSIPGTWDYKVTVMEAMEAKDGMPARPARPMARLYGQGAHTANAEEGRFTIRLSPDFAPHKVKVGKPDFAYSTYLQLGGVFKDANKRTHKTVRELMEWLKDNSFQFRVMHGDTDPLVVGFRAYRGR